MPNPYDFSSGIIVNVVSWVLTVTIGVLLARTLGKWWDEWRYGGWEAVVRCGPACVEVWRRISPSKAKQILDDTADLSVFLKGLCSPYDQLNGDIIKKLENATPGADGADRGRLVTRDEDLRLFIVDLRYNPPPRPRNPRPAVQ